MDKSDGHNYKTEILLHFATNVRKKREADSSVFLAPPQLAFIWLLLFSRSSRAG
jgi:hypothetical protein